MRIEKQIDSRNPSVQEKIPTNVAAVPANTKKMHMAEKTVNRNDLDTTKTKADENPTAIAAA